MENEGLSIYAHYEHKVCVCVVTCWKIRRAELEHCVLLWFHRTVQHERYGTLTLVNSTGADTGEYTCYPMYCEDTDCRKEYDKAIKVFVFFAGNATQKVKMKLHGLYQNIQPVWFNGRPIDDSIFSYRFTVQWKYSWETP